VILVDTSVWIEHLRSGSAKLVRLLRSGQVWTHAFIIGEIACGDLRNRSRILADLAALPLAVSATDEEVLRLIDERKLWGKGIGWVDAHLLASAALSKCPLWTLDNALRRAANSLGADATARS
jgi:predicted nucleic acid-binding protein